MLELAKLSLIIIGISERECGGVVCRTEINLSLSP